MKTFVSSLSNKEFPESEKVHGNAVRHGILELIQMEHPNFGDDDLISTTELNHYRQKYVADYLLKEVGEISEMERTVLETLQNNEVVSDKMLEDPGANFTFGQRLADKIAAFGGSWNFIIIFGFFIFFWMGINVWFLTSGAFDPYPFILLNLILSSLAALQAPVIMMSQNRQEEKDRERAKQDYMVNLKSELEIRMLHEKLDHLIVHQQQELLSIQQIQIEMMEDIMKKLESKGG